MRVVIISMVPESVEEYSQLLHDLGHETVGVLTMKNTRLPEAAPGVLAATPEGIDTVVAGSKERIAPLLRSYEPDVAVCSGFGWKLDADALAAPRLGIVNGHPSLLPQWRGPNPFSWTLRSGENVLGFTFHLMDTGLDTGPILAQGSVPLTDDDSIATLSSDCRASSRSCCRKRSHASSRATAAIRNPTRTRRTQLCTRTTTPRSTGRGPRGRSTTRCAPGSCRRCRESRAR